MATMPLGVVGSVAYTEVVGDAPPGSWTRHSEGLSLPAPKHVSVKNRSPLNGSTASGLGHVNPDETVPSTAPDDGSTFRMTPVLKPPPVAPRATYRFPSLPNTGCSRVWPIVARLLALEIAP